MSQTGESSHGVPRRGDALIALAGLVLAVGTGCAETDGVQVSDTVQQSSCPTGSARRASVPPEVVQAFNPCCDGAARLIPEFLIPTEFHGMLEKQANNMLCVPEEFATDASYTPKRCKSIFGLAGACISRCVPQVGKAEVPLPKDICEGNQLCAPCRDPRTNQETGACKMGQMACEKTPDDMSGPCKDYEPTLDVSGFQSCCPGGRAHCAPAELVAGNQAKDLSTCADGKSFCVPDDFLMRGGKYTPPTCKSIGGREGRCLSICVKSVADQKDSLPQSSCQPDERCAPCYDPRTGMGTGACSVGHCDKGPQEPPRTFEQCGDGKGAEAFCVPADLVPANERANFDNKGCKATPCTEPNTLCLPRRVMEAGATFSPKKCQNSLWSFLVVLQKLFSDPIGAFTAAGNYKDGRCLSSCIPKVRAQAGMLSQNGCDAGDVCVPCFDPTKANQGKVPTGACDR